VIALPEEILPPVDLVRRIQVAYQGDLRFGVSTTTGNPDDPSDDGKKLTFDEEGGTNNTRLWVDGATPMIGDSSGRLIRAVESSGEDRIEAEWAYGDIHVAQTVQYVAGETSRRMDCVRVEYRVENKSTAGHEVGLRVMLDSLIGGNDGVPFIVPGREQLVTAPESFTGEQVPDFVRALEVADLVNPGVIADLGLRPDESERPDEVILTHWPGGDAAWDYDRTSEFGSDTAIGLYYRPRTLDPGARRLIRFSYGLGSISSTATGNARLSLTAGGPFRSGGKFWLVALVQNPKPGQQVRLDLPEGFRLGAGHEPVKAVGSAAGYNQLSWLVEIGSATLGAAQIRAILTPDDVEERHEIVVQPRDARLILQVKPPVRSGKPFWVSALVQHAKAGQSLELQLPSGLTLAQGHVATKLVPAKEGYSQVHWLIASPPQAQSQARISVRLLPGGLEEEVAIDIQQGTLID
jgi:hypothetical protein